MVLCKRSHGAGFMVHGFKTFRLHGHNRNYHALLRTALVLSGPTKILNSQS